MPPHSELANAALVVGGLPVAASASASRFRKAAHKRRYKRSRSNSKSSQPSDEELSSSGPCPADATPKAPVKTVALYRQPSVVTFKEAPEFLQFNEFIHNGYRTNLCVATCVRSLFWWTNETLNAWTHLLGWVYFAYYTVREIGQFVGQNAWHDSFMMIVILVCFQICMAMSTGYHTFCCHSQHSYHCWLAYDLCGISFSLLAIYVSGIYYAFWCDHFMRTTYLTVVAVMFTGALVLQTQSKFMTDEYARARLFFFMAWSCFGFLPCTHWAILNGGFSHAFVLDLVGRIGIMYIICGVALFFYISRIPERWFPGCVDYIGSSHQWWHIIIFSAFLHWQRTGQYYAEFRARHGCFEADLLPAQAAQAFGSHGTVSNFTGW